MNHPVRQPMTAAQFLAWEARQDRKWEFDGLRPVAMVGVTVAHSTIQGNVITSLNARLRGQSCRPHGPELKIATAFGFRYPDAFVTCTPSPPDASVITQPVVVFEVLSRSTQRLDRTIKLLEYQAILSVQRYVMLEQDQAFATVVERRGDDWTLRSLGPDAVLAMPEIGIEVPLAEVYADVAFPPDPDAVAEDARAMADLTPVAPQLRQAMHRIEVDTPGRGLLEVTAPVLAWVAAQRIAAGLLTVWCRHTSASLLVQENADPDVRADLEAFFARIAPEGGKLYRHRDEGPDDMPAHIRAALTATQLSIPVEAGRPVLGTWQGLYVFEHRAAPHRRELALHLLGEG